jgi:hypothetical protein
MTPVTPLKEVTRVAEPVLVLILYHCCPAKGGSADRK